MNRRRFLLTGAAGVGGILTGCSGSSGPNTSSDSAHLTARPGTPSASPSLGKTPLGLGIDRDGFIYVPPGYNPATPASLVVLLHGAGQSSNIWAAGPLDSLFGARNIVVMAPDSRGASWDLRLGGFGADVEFIDIALSLVFSRCAIDASSIALGGFSDGASYALSLGASNGDLFTALIGFSPGFFEPDRLRGKPKIFLSHGTADPILPFSWTSATLAPTLSSQGYSVKFVQFDGGHTVPLPVATEAMDWLKGTVPV